MIHGIYFDEIAQFRKVRLEQRKQSFFENRGEYLSILLYIFLELKSMIRFSL